MKKQSLERLYNLLKAGTGTWRVFLGFSSRSDSEACDLPTPGRQETLRNKYVSGGIVRYCWPDTYSAEVLLRTLTAILFGSLAISHKKAVESPKKLSAAALVGPCVTPKRVAPSTDTGEESQR